MSYELRRRQLLVFGGVGPNSRDTWVLQGTLWRAIVPPLRPSARSGHRIAYDLPRNRSILFGGLEGYKAVGDTWEWDGEAWARIPSKGSPAPRYGHAMIFSTRSARTLVFGGRDERRFHSDLWSYDGRAWRQIGRQPGPSARANAAACFDRGRQRLVLYGGQNGRYLGDTWEWDGVQWHKRKPRRSPSARAFATMCYDSLRRRSVLYGGADSQGLRGDTWEWDGTDWVKREAATVPPAMWHPIAEYDMQKRAVILLGRASTWSYASSEAARHTSFGSGCARASADPVLSARSLPWMGQDYRLRLEGLSRASLAILCVGTSRRLWRTLRLPLRLLPQRAPLCKLFVRPDALYASASLGGRADFEFPIAEAPALSGRSLYLQGLSIDPARGLQSLAMSAAAEARIGRL